MAFCVYCCHKAIYLVRKKNTRDALLRMHALTSLRFVLNRSEKKGLKKIRKRRSGVNLIEAKSPRAKYRFAVGRHEDAKRFEGKKIQSVSL